MKTPEFAVFKDGAVTHYANWSLLPNYCFRLCDNPGDPFQVKSSGYRMPATMPVSCFTCLAMHGRTEEERERIYHGRGYIPL